MGNYSIAQADPIPETAQKLAGPLQSGVTYEAPSWLRIALTAGALNTITKVQNPYGEDRLITRAIVRVTTAGESSAVLDIDVVGTSCATGDDIGDAVAISAVARKDCFLADGGTNGEDRAQLWEKAGGTNDWLTAKVLVDGATALVGTLFVESITAASP